MCAATKELFVECNDRSTNSRQVRFNGHRCDWKPCKKIFKSMTDVDKSNLSLNCCFCLFNNSGLRYVFISIENNEGMQNPSVWKGPALRLLSALGYRTPFTAVRGEHC
jgi:hypothetical protein